MESKSDSFHPVSENRIPETNNPDMESSLVALEEVGGAADHDASRVDNLINGALDEVLRAAGEKPAMHFAEMLDALRQSAADLVTGFKRLAAYAEIAIAAGLLVGCVDTFTAESPIKEHEKEWKRIKNIVPEENQKVVRDYFKRSYLEPVDPNMSADSLITQDPHTLYLSREEAIKFDESLKSGITGQFMLPDQKTGYIKLDTFDQGSAIETKKVIDRLKEQNMQQLVLDLRYNGGGFMNEALGIVDRFISSGKLMLGSKVRTNLSNMQEYHSTYSTYRQSWDGPLIILVNHESASASEIVAGALQDMDRAVIVGEMTFGKGLIQREYKMWNGDRLLLVTGQYFLPSGRSIQRPYIKWPNRDEYYDAAYDAAARAEHASTETYCTAGGREVYGENGVMPDTTISDHTFPIEIRKIIDYHRDAVSTFAKTFSERHALPEDIEEFLVNFSVDASTLAEFKQVLTDADKAHNGGKLSGPLSDYTFDAHLNHLLAREIGYAKYGMENVQWQTDEELRAAAGVFDTPLFEKITGNVRQEGPTAKNKSFMAH